eukprot:1598168-Prymnesium_polylepis.1
MRLGGFAWLSDCFPPELYPNASMRFEWSVAGAGTAPRWERLSPWDQSIAMKTGVDSDVSSSTPVGWDALN